MRILELMKKAFVSSCIFFTIIIVIYSLIVIAFFNGMGMNPTSVFLLFPFSYVITLANYIFKYTNLSKGTKIVLHFLMYTASTVIFVYIPHGSAFSPKNSMILFVIYCIFYIIGLLIYSLVKSAKLRKSEKKTEYKSVY